MALEETTGGTNMYMPVAPAYGNNGNGFGFGGDGLWILLLIILCNGGWGGFGGFGNGWGAMGMADGFGLYPWLNNSQNINDGFRDQMFNTSVTSIGDKITSGFGDIQTALCGGFGNVQNAMCSGFGDVQNALCGGFAGVNASINGAQNAIAQQMYANQLSDLERSFAAQTANTAGLTGLSAQLAQYASDNKSTSLENRYALAQEACATRTADANNTTAVLNALNSGIQSIKDQLCSDKIEQKNDIIAQLRSELMYARGQASQDVQTAAIQAGQRTLANEIEQYVAPRAIPSYPVQNPNCCGNYTGCGCGV